MAPRRRRHPSATPLAGTVTGTARGTNPAEQADVRLRGRSALAPPRLREDAPARGVPGLAHRFGSPVLPIKLQAWVTVVTPLDPRK